jgi:HK97 gp10 family phage protein
MSEFKVTVSGLNELEQKLRDESKKVAIRTVRRAAKDAGEIWIAAIEARAPALTGFMRTHVEMNTKAKSGDEGSLTLIVGPDKKAFYDIFDEFGTKHQKANPFMRPAFEETKAQVLDKFVSDLRDELNALQEHR